MSQQNDVAFSWVAFVNIWATFYFNIWTHCSLPSLYPISLPYSAPPSQFLSPTSVTRLGDLLDFGHLFKAFGNN